MRDLKCIVLFLFSIAKVIVADKRLLLNDPDVMAQLKQMSLELQTLQQTTTRLEQESTQLKQKLSQKSLEVSQIKLDLGSANNKITQLENSNSGKILISTLTSLEVCRYHIYIFLLLLIFSIRLFVENDDQNEISNM